jgi:tRNA threonylcarbamoyl adenosine modification protein YeaZ
VLLAIDTSVGTSVAVVDRDGGILAERGSADTRRHAELVGTFIDECLAESGVAVSALSGVVAGMGPGPFTGLRVGIAAATAFALGAEIPLIRVISHDAVAFAVGGPLLVVTDARRKEQYWSSYEAADELGLPVRVEGPALSSPADVPAATHRIDAVTISAGSLGMLAEAMYVNGRPFADSQAVYLRSPDVTPSNGPKRVTG